jgi:hypothetical protein
MQCLLHFVGCALGGARGEQGGEQEGRGQYNTKDGSLRPSLFASMQLYETRFARLSTFAEQGGEQEGRGQYNTKDGSLRPSLFASMQLYETRFARLSSFALRIYATFYETRFARLSCCSRKRTWHMDFNAGGLYFTTSPPLTNPNPVQLVSCPCGIDPDTEKVRQTFR